MVLTQTRVHLLATVKTGLLNPGVLDLYHHQVSMNFFCNSFLFHFLSSFLCRSDAQLLASILVAAYCSSQFFIFFPSVASLSAATIVFIRLEA